MQEVGPAVEVSESFRVDSKMPSFMADILRKNEDEEAAKNGDNLTGEERREVTMSILKDHFGDRVIHYKKYSGTVEDIVDDCPAAYYYFKKGPEAFIEWVEAEETEPIHDTDDATNESREDEIFTVAEEGMVESSYADQQKDALAEKESLEVSKADQTASKNDEALDSIPDEQASAVDKAEPDRRDRSRVDKKANAERSEKTEKVSKDKKVDTSREKNKKQPTQSQVEAVVEVLQEPEVFKPVINIDAPNITNKPEQDVKTEKTDLVADEPSPEMAATQHLESFQTDSPEEDVPAEVNDAADSQSIEELQTNTDLIDEVLLNEDIEKPQSTQVVAQFENWQEFAKDEPLLDELFITMSEQLDTELFNESDLEIIPPAKLKLESMDVKAAERTRSIIMFLGPLLHQYDKFEIPFAGGCSLGERTVEPHLSGLEPFGMKVHTTTDRYEVSNTPVKPERSIVLSERGDTVTENILMAAALNDGVTTIRNASPNYMIQDLCFYLEKLGVKIDGIGTTTLVVRGVRDINKNVEYAPAEDPIEVMSFIAAAIVTKSEITIKRAPIEFLEIELKFLENMGFEYELSDEYTALNGQTRLVDITTKVSKLVAAVDKIHPMPFPGLNIDNLPFFAIIAATAKGRTLIHDWVYENRAIYLTELSKLNAKIELVDPHRIYVEGPTKWKAAEIVTPPALRPAVVILLAMLAAPGVSVLRNVYSINRGYEDLALRLNTLGAKITIIRDITD